MKGKLIKTSRGWEVEYEEKVPQLHFLAKRTVAILLHPDDIKNILPKYVDIGQNPHKEYFYEGEVEFEIIEVHCAQIGFENVKFNHISQKFAKLITRQEESSNWDEIFKIWRTTKNLDNYEISYNDWLKEHYNPPVKR